jgi:putative Mg2+ transporter-C (MgtC) family protein
VYRGGTRNTGRVTHVSLAQECLRLAVAAGLGAAIGLERELRAQPAGFRTHVLVALGAGLFTVAGTNLAGADPTRVAAQVVTGIGFLGAGAILHDRGGVRGLTTAASLWIAAAAGLASGLGRPGLATFTVAMALLALVGLKYLEREAFPRRRGHTVVLEIDGSSDLHVLVEKVTGALGAPITLRSIERAGHDRAVLTLSSPLRQGFSIVDLAMRLRALDGVMGVELGV